MSYGAQKKTRLLAQKIEIYQIHGAKRHDCRPKYIRYRAQNVIRYHHIAKIKLFDIILRRNLHIHIFTT